MKVYYLGQFPPPYGGVTVKNALLAEALADRVPVEKVGFRDVGTVKIVRLLMTSKDGLFMPGSVTRGYKGLYFVCSQSLDRAFSLGVI